MKNIKECIAFICCHKKRKSYKIVNTKFEANEIEIKVIPSEEQKVQDEKKLTEEVVTTKEQEKNLDDEVIIPEKYIREDEKDKIIFSVNGILKLLEYFKEVENNWISICKRNTIVMDYRNGSFLNEKFILLRMFYTIPKSLFTVEHDLKLLVETMYDPEIRMRYDNSLKSYKILEKQDKFCIFHNHVLSPMFLISERDIVDKRLEFYRDNSYYCFTSSVDNYLPEIENVVRCTTYINFIHIREDEGNYYFECYNQYDAKSMVPEKIINFTVPNRNEEWFRLFVKEINSLNSTK